MDLETFARLETAAGAKVTRHDGIWWERIKPFYSRPLHLLRAFPYDTGKPPFSYRFVGYEHAVPDEREANAFLPLMLLQDISGYDIERLPPAKRNKIRQGLKHVEVRRLDDIQDLIEQGPEINRSNLARWGGDRRGYLDESLWKRVLERTHALGVRETWGAYVKGRLVAYMRAYVIEETAYDTQRRSHSEYLQYRPNDILLHTFLMSCKVRPEIRRVLSGLESAQQSLTEYKKAFGFEAVKLPIYRRMNPVVRYIVQFTRYRRYLQPVTGLPHKT